MRTITLLLTLILGAGFQLDVRPAHANAGELTGPITEAGPQKVTRVANSFPGGDLGAKINAADKDLGSRPGEILVNNGGTISTQVVLSSGHTLRFAPGTYRLTTGLLWEGAFLLNSNTSVTGSGWETIIVEPPQTGWIVFQSFSDIRTKPTGSATESDINITNLQIKGANPKVDGGIRETIQLGNCHRCKVEHVWLNGTGVIGVQAGGNGLKGNFADTVTIRNNLFTAVASQAVAVVNGRNVVIDGNVFKDSGRNGMQGMTAIDLEPNDGSDVIQHIEITNNRIDSTGSTFLHGNGILVQNGAGTRGFGPVLIKGNTVIGGNLIPDFSGRIATGIYVASGSQDVTVINNTIRRVAHAGIRLDNVNRVYVANNTLVSTGTGGILAFEVMSTRNSKILNNVISVDPNSPMGNSVIQESGASQNNSYSGNTDGRARIDPVIRSPGP